jgi:hypothetical protein
MEQLLNLLNEYEESMIDKSLEEEDPEWIYEYPKVWTEFNWHLWFNNASKVQFPDEMFDYYAFSKEYWFIKHLVMNKKVDYNNSDELITDIVLSENPIKYLISQIETNLYQN